MTDEELFDATRAEGDDERLPHDVVKPMVSTLTLKRPRKRGL